MAREELVHALEELMSTGFWATREDLMGRVITWPPRQFNDLTDKYALEILNYGNEILLAEDKPIICISDSMNRCVDIWEEGDGLSHQKDADDLIEVARPRFKKRFVRLYPNKERATRVENTEQYKSNPYTGEVVDTPVMEDIIEIGTIGSAETEKVRCTRSNYC